MESAVVRLNGGRGRKLLMHLYGIQRPPKKGHFQHVVGLEWEASGFKFHVETSVEDAQRLLEALRGARDDAS